jgi:hypothetical protein
MFSGCTSLSSIIIPNNIATIEDAAFYNCTSLTRVTFNRANIQLEGEFDLVFPGDLEQKYLAGGAGTYTRPSGGTTWTKQ